LGIGLWLGQYRGLNRLWLRWYDQDGNWIPTEAERTDRISAEAFRQSRRFIAQRGLRPYFNGNEPNMNANRRNWLNKKFKKNVNKRNWLNNELNN